MSVDKPNVDGRTDDGQRPILKPHLSNQENCPTFPGGHVHRAILQHDWAKNLTSRETNVLTKFYENWAKNVTSIVFTCFHYIHWGPCFFAVWTILKLVRDINKTNVLTKFHDDFAKTENCPTRTIFELNSHWTKNVTSRGVTCFHYLHIEKTVPLPCGHVFFELVRDINETNVLTKFHDYWAKIVTSRVITWKTAPPTGSHVFQWTRTTFKLNQHIIKTNILQSFKLDRYIIGTNPLTKLHGDLTRNVASRVFTSFELDRRIIGTNLLTKFHEDRTRNVASRLVS
ncbi:hypothetical protein DPMN_181858 [Dreissena polymorpha]|uniref:Uncharacterized protein n=1 Tax=Dreissena polymorpha TaxID=45954 RepID=A0A9D4I220_DREPO|nr:hypothetical protein DPMN_181858 [Dreissena polymorpha]